MNEEEAEAKRDGAKTQKNSGRGKHEKGDATLGPFCIDYKHYTESFSVSRAVWAKISTDAWKVKRLPALKLVLGSEGDTTKTRLWVVSDTMFREMLEAWEKQQEEVK